MSPKDNELQLLEIIYSKKSDTQASSQRILAGASGLSLGMTNALLKRFVERGWVKLMHISGRSMSYALTSSGMEEVLRRSIAYFSRAVRSASLYRDKIDAYMRDLAKSGFTTVVLEGPAELDFLFDYSCERHGLKFVKNPSGEKRDALAASAGTMFVTARSFPPFEEDCEEIISDKPDSKIDGSKQLASHVRLSEILFDCADYLASRGNVSV